MPKQPPPQTNLVKYGSYSVEDAEADEQELAKGSSPMMKLETGINKVRFLPPLQGAKLFYIAWQHYIELPGIDQPVRFNCPRQMARKPCPACEAADALSNTGSAADQESAKKFWAKKRSFANVIDRKDPESGPKAFGMAKQIHDKLVGLRKNEEAGGDFTDPSEDGFDVLITKPVSFKGGKQYEVQAAKALSPLGDLDWIEAQPDLRRFLVIPSREELEEQCEESGILDIISAAKSSNRRGPTGPSRQLSRAPAAGGKGGRQAPPARRTAAASAMGDDDEDEGPVTGEVMPPSESDEDGDELKM